MWKKTLRHPNVLPPMGVTMGNHQLAIASESMTNGNINEFIQVHRDANQLELVRSYSYHWLHQSLIIISGSSKTSLGG